MNGIEKGRQHIDQDAQAEINRVWRTPMPRRRMCWLVARRKLPLRRRS